MIRLKTKEQIASLRKCGKKLATILNTLAKEVVPGVSTATLDEMAGKLMAKAGGKSAFLDYTPLGAKRPYPANICISVNQEIVHGIPNENPKIIKAGDLVTLDGGLVFEGMITDHAITIMVEVEDKRVKELVARTKEALMAGIKQARVGNHVGDIGAAISKVAEKSNLSIMQSLSGHGVGFEVHEDPYVPNYGQKGQGEELVPGMVIAIEPMFGLGGGEIRLMRDGYTYETRDGSLSAQFEHTVAITEKGPVILTDL